MSGLGSDGEPRRERKRSRAVAGCRRGRGRARRAAGPPGVLVVIGVLVVLAVI